MYQEAFGHLTVSPFSQWKIQIWGVCLFNEALNFKMDFHRWFIFFKTEKSSRKILKAASTENHRFYFQLDIAF